MFCRANELEDIEIMAKTALARDKWNNKRCWENVQGALNAQIFKQNKSFKQLEKQAECDMIGISRGKSDRVVYHALEVAVHTRQGLEYTGIRAGKRANVSDDKVVAKLFNAAMALYANIDVTSGEVLFLTPYVKPQLLKRIETRLQDLADHLHHIELGAGRHFDFEFKIIANDAFTEKVLNPILEIGDDVADTSELFVRAMQIYKISSILHPWDARRSRKALEVPRVVENGIGTRGMRERQVGGRGKANARIAKWAAERDRKPHKIIRAFYQVAQNGSASFLAMRRLCENAQDTRVYISKFMSCWASITTDAGNSYGKVFERHGDVVTIWGEVWPSLERYKNSFIR